MNPKPVTGPAPMRLNRWLAERGCASRRGADDAIDAGRVRLNDKVATKGMLVGGDDRVLFDGRLVSAPATPATPMAFVYHKPVGVICSERDNSRRPLARVCALHSLKKSLPAGSANAPSWSKVQAQRWMMVGRLDLNTSGLLLFVNDGLLCHALMHPSTQISRLYRVRVHGRLKKDDERRLLTGIYLGKQFARFESIQALSIDRDTDGLNRWYVVELKQGINREIRRLFEAVDCQVSRLARVRFANIDLSGLRDDQSRMLNKRELLTLTKLAKL